MCRPIMLSEMFLTVQNSVSEGYQLFGQTVNVLADLAYCNLAGPTPVQSQISYTGMAHSVENFEV